MTNDLIGQFLSDYRQRQTELGKRLPPNDVLRVLLEEFELFELGGTVNDTRMKNALRSLGRTFSTKRKMRATIRIVTREMAALRARLERQVDANLMMQEHLVMLSDRQSNQPPTLPK